MPPRGDVVQPGDHRQHGRLAAAGMADQRDELALAHQQVEAVDYRERALRRRIVLAHLEELDIALLEGRVGGILVRARRTVVELHRHDVRRRAAVVGVAGGAAQTDIHEILRDGGAQPLVGWTGVHRGSLARPRERHAEFRAEARLRSGIERDDAVGEQDRLVDVVGDQHHRLLFLRPDVLDFGLQLGAGQRVERRQRLVEQQHFRVHGERARHRHALAHAAGQLRRLALAGMRKAYHLGIAVDARRAFACRLAGEHRVDRQRHVAAYRQPRHQRVALEHQPRSGPGSVTGLPLNSTSPESGAIEAGHQIDQRGLAGAGEADDGDEFALRHLERHVLEHARARRLLAVDLEADLSSRIGFAISFTASRCG